VEQIIEQKLDAKQRPLEFTPKIHSVKLEVCGTKQRVFQQTNLKKLQQTQQNDYSFERGPSSQIKIIPC
jgi:hypothetical protein